MHLPDGLFHHSLCRSRGLGAQTPHEGGPMSSSARRKTGFIVTGVAVALAGLSLAYAYWSYLANPWTRDGQVQAQVIQVSPRVSGPVVDLPIKNNQFVKEGELLLAIDPRTFQARVDQLAALVGKASAATAEARDQYERVKRAYDSDRGGAVSRLTYVEKENALRAAEASQKEAEADLASAQLDLDFTRLISPADGYVTNLKLQPGSNTVADRPALALIAVETFRVYGFFKETQIARIRTGDKAMVRLMSYPGMPLDGEVESLGWGIAQRNGSTGIDLLPNVSPSFDWIRLAQRIPVIVRLGKLPEGVELRVGTTATVIVTRS